MVLFFDVANYTKSNNDPLHAFFSQISELPPLLRYSTRNIITHSLWTGSTADFNLFLSRYNNQLDRLLVDGILIEDLNIKIKVNWLTLPTYCIIDYMHASLLGTTKHLLNMWVSNNSRSKEYYLGQKLENIDNIFLLIKYPTEFPRQQRSISHHLQFFKASEFRYFFFYARLPVLRYFLPTTYYNHFVQYVVIIWLLCVNFKCRYYSIV